MGSRTGYQHVHGVPLNHMLPNVFYERDNGTMATGSSCLVLNAVPILVRMKRTEGLPQLYFTLSGRSTRRRSRYSGSAVAFPASSFRSA